MAQSPKRKLKTSVFLGHPSAEGQRPEKKTRKCEISINLGGACNKSKKKKEEGISAGEIGQKGGEEMVLVTELGVTERY